MTQVKRRSFLKCGLAGTAATAASLLPMAAHAQAAETKPNTDYDVIVVGCGCAGMAAAIEAADKGAKVAIFEKMSRPAGNTIFAGGHFNATNTYVQKQQNMKDTLDDFYKDMMIVSQQRGDQALTRQYCEMSGSAIQWLTDTCGIKWKPIVEEVFPGRNRGHVVDGKLKPGGAQLSKQMLDTVKAKKIPVFFDSKVISLLNDPALRVTGVRVVDEDGEVTDYAAKGGVILCTGGFHANKEMVCRYMGGDVAWMPIRGSNVLQGENITLTQHLFPKYVNMNQFHAMDQQEQILPQWLTMESWSKMTALASWTKLKPMFPLLRRCRRSFLKTGPSLLSTAKSLTFQPLRPVLTDTNVPKLLSMKVLQWPKWQKKPAFRSTLSSMSLKNTTMQLKPVKLLL